jgi:hypothetical protein
MFNFAGKTYSIPAVINNRYEVGKTVGNGGFGTIFQGRDL